MLPNPYMIYGALGLAAVGFGAGWQVREWRCEAALTASLEAAAATEDAADGVIAEEAADYETTRADIAETSVIERTEVREIYRDIEVPADCAVDPAARGVLEGARIRANAAASGELGSAVQPAGERP